MQFPRRRFLRTAAGVAAAAALPRFACALDYPTRPVRLVIGFSAGSSPDIVARLFAEWLSTRLGQTFVIENRPGAGTNIATEAVVRAPPDGYTLLLIASPNMFNTTLYRNLNFNFIRDIAPIGCVTTTPFVMVINPAVPANSVAEFIAYAKANPGKINMTSTGTGNLTHFAGELFKMMTGIDMVHVPGNSEMQAQSDLLTGRAQVMFDPISSSLGYIKAGRLRTLAVTTAKPLQMLPDVPTIGEFVPGYEVDGNLGIGAPKGTPDEIITTLSSAINAAVRDPGITSRLDALGLVPTAMAPAEFAAFISSETEKWAKVIKFANIKTE